MNRLLWGLSISVLPPLLAQSDVASSIAAASWLRLGAEVRARTEPEAFVFSGVAISDTATYTRVRLRADAAPRTWFHVSAQLQDARTVAGPAEKIGEYVDNHLDVQYLYADLGTERASLRMGRQALSFGDERLLGADGLWDNRSQRFDGVRSTFQTGAWEWDVFSATPVEIRPTQWDPVSGAERLSGAYGHRSIRNMVWEPYIFWKRTRTPLTNNAIERADLWTPGLRAAIPAGWGFDSVIEMAVQRGIVTENRVSAWAGYWELSRPFNDVEGAPRLTVSYSYASGDGNSRDRRNGTFSDLYPAGFNGCGFFEPFAWRNVRDLRAGAEWTIWGGSGFATEFHRYWLANLADGAYFDGGPPVVFDPAASSPSLGSRLLFRARHSFGSHFDAAAGYAKFFPGRYLQHGLSLSHSAFISWTARL